MTLALALALSFAPPAVTAVPDTALLTYESGILVAADWIQRRGPYLHTRSVLAQSGIRDTWIELGDSALALGSSVTIADAGEEAGKPIVRALGAGAVYWSDQIPSSIEQAVLRARALGTQTSLLAGASLFRDSRVPIRVERASATDWAITCNQKRYDALTDDDGNLLAATLPDYGVVIERRIGFRPKDYPLWPRYAARPGGSYRAEEVRIRAPRGHVLAGTLTIPKPGRLAPAVVLITGLSPHERNNGDPPWMPFRDLADALSEHGVAVLRVDDRGVGASTGDRASSTTLDEADDVRTEVAWLRKRAGIDPRRIALVGYSEGGLIAPIVAAGDSSLAGIVTMAGPGVPGPEVARYQIESAVMRDSSIAPADREAEIQKQLADTLTVRERSYLALDPLAYARRVRCPALILHGGSDLHIPPRSAERLARVMRANGNRDVSVRIFPGISHSFLPDPVGLSSRWAVLPGFVTSPEVLRTITEWVAMRFARGHRAS